MKTALVVNAYSLGNWGDTAITEGVISSLRSAGFDHIVGAGGLARTRPRGAMTVDADEYVQPLVNLYDVPRWLRRPRPPRSPTSWPATSGSDSVGPQTRRSRATAARTYVVSVGGAYLGGAKPGLNLIKAVNIHAGVLAGRPTIVAPVTVNPFTPSVRRILRWGLRDAGLFARDAPTLELLRGAGLAGSLVPDIAFRAPTLVRLAASTATASPRSGTAVIGWAPRSYRADHRAWGDPGAAEQVTLAAVRTILATSADRLRFIPHVRAGTADDDLNAVHRLLAQLTPAEQERVDMPPTPETLEESVRQYAEVDVLITSRMHAAIFALAAGTPAVAVAYEPKVAGVMTDIGPPERVVPADGRLSAGGLVDLVARLRTPAERERTREAYARVQGRFGAFDAALRAAAAGA